jgi:YbbR domain-containing protein
MEYRIDVSGAQRGEAVYEIDPGRIEEQLPNGARIVSRSPASLELKFARRGRKSIRVRADIVGEPLEGYNVAWVEVDPAYVWLTGDRREVVSMREAITEPIEIRGVRESIERDVRLALPDHVWMEEGRPLRVRVQVDEIPKRGAKR